jgi:hypothetical protein
LSSRLSNWLIVFPNPAGNYFTIEYLIPETSAKDASIEIRGIDGRLIQIIPVKDTQNQVVINSSALAKGIYLCFLKQGSVISQTTRVVIHK